MGRSRGDLDRREVSTLPRRELERLRRIAATLSRVYGDPRLGNKDDPLDELIYIILSAKTTESSFVKTYESLHSGFPDWFAVLRVPRGRIARIIKSGGLSRKKETQIRGLLGHLKLTGIHNLRSELDRLDDHDAERFLRALPGVGMKTARCVLMYSLDRQVFPVDVHASRVLSRLGFAPEGRLTDPAQNEIQACIPPSLRYSMHVNLVAHGRLICRPTKPSCSECPLLRSCPYPSRKHGA